MEQDKNTPAVPAAAPPQEQPPAQPAPTGQETQPLESAPQNLAAAPPDAAPAAAAPPDAPPALVAAAPQDGQPPGGGPPPEAGAPPRQQHLQEQLGQQLQQKQQQQHQHTHLQQQLQQVPFPERLDAFYRAFNPEKLANVPQIAKHFHGKEDKLNEYLRQQYSGRDLNATIPAAAATAAGAGAGAAGAAAGPSASYSQSSGGSTRPKSKLRDIMSALWPIISPEEKRTVQGLVQEVKRAHGAPAGHRRGPQLSRLRACARPAECVCECEVAYCAN